MSLSCNTVSRESHMPMADWYTQYPSQANSSSSGTLYEPVGWKPVYTEMVRMSVQGMPVRKIQHTFRRFGVKYSGTHIRRILQSTRGQEMASLMSAQVHGGTEGLQGQLGAFLPEALSVELEIMRHPFEAARHRIVAAQDILDRGGLPKISRQESNSLPPQTIIVNLLPSQMSSFLLPPPVIDAEIVEVSDRTDD